MQKSWKTGIQYLIKLVDNSHINIPLNLITSHLDSVGVGWSLMRIKGMMRIFGCPGKIDLSLGSPGKLFL